MAALKASGGSTLSPAGMSAAAPAYPVTGGNAHMASSVLSWLAVLIAIIAIAAGAYLGYGYLTRAEAPVAPPEDVSETLPASSTTSTGGLASLTPTVSTHNSLLPRKPAAALSFSIEAPKGTLKTHFQLIREALERVPAAARTAELTPTNAAGMPLSFAGFLTLIGAQDLLPAQGYMDHIADDFSFLAVRGQGGFSGAYVLGLKPNATWVYAEPTVRTIESSPALQNIFLQVPGTPVGEFADATINETTVRSITYQNPAGTLIYGWFKNRLVIATSRQALDETLLLLCLEIGSDC